MPTGSLIGHKTPEKKTEQEDSPAIQKESEKKPAIQSNPFLSGNMNNNPFLSASNSDAGSKNKLTFKSKPASDNQQQTQNDAQKQSSLFTNKPSETKPQNEGGLFGQNKTAVPATGGIFGQKPQTDGPSLFPSAQTVPNSTQPTSSSLFGQPPNSSNT